MLDEISWIEDDWSPGTHARRLRSQQLSLKTGNFDLLDEEVEDFHDQNVGTMVELVSC